MKTEDRRDRARKKAVHETMLALLSEKKLSQISIVELTTLADINRKTFYNHYSDLYAVVGEIEDEIVEGLQELLEKNLPDNLAEHSLTPKEMDELAAEIAVPFFTALIEALKVSSSYPVIIQNCEGHCHIQQKIADMEKEMLLRFLDDRTKNIGMLDYYVTFLVEGASGVINRWSRDGFRTPTDELAEFFKRLFKPM